MIGGHVIKNYENQSEFARTYYGQGRTEGRTEGRAEGQRSAIIQIAKARFTAITAEDEAFVNAVTDIDEVRRIVVEVATAPSYEAFQAQLVTRSKS